MKKYVIQKFINKKEVSREIVELSDYKARKLKKELSFLDYSNDFKGSYLKINWYNENEEAFNRIIEIHKISKYILRNINFFNAKYSKFDIKTYINKIEKELKTLRTLKIHLTEYLLDIFLTIENIRTITNYLQDSL